MYRILMRTLPLFVALVFAGALLPAARPAQAASPPDVVRLEPTSGPIAGGTLVQVTGFGFTGATSVTFGGTAVAPLVIHDRLLLATAPPHAAGLVDVRVTTPAGTSPNTPNDDFRYLDPAALAPTVAAVSPGSGPTSGGTLVTITGTNLAGATAVEFGGSFASPISSTSTQVQVFTPPHPVGTYAVRVTTPAGTSTVNSASQFQFLDGPTITSVSPTFGPTSGGTVVTIVGTNLAGTLEVRFGGLSVVPTSVSNTTVIATTPPSGAGTVNVRVRTPAGLSPLSNQALFTFIGNGPTVTAVNPTAGSTAGGTVVTISGTGFTGATNVNFGGVNVAPASVSPTQIVAVAPPHGAGTVHVRVTTPEGTSPETNLDLFTYVTGVPFVLGVTPKTGPTTGGTVITITGTGFTGATAVSFSPQVAVPQSVTDTQIVVISPPHPAGTVDLRVTTPIATSAPTPADDFTFVTGNLQVVSVSPPGGPTTGGTVVTIVGTGFTGANGVLFGDSFVTPISVSSTTVVAISPPHPAGTVHVRVLTPAGTTAETSADLFTYGSGFPVVTGLSPAAGPVEGGTVVIVRGTGFSGATAVSFGSVSRTPFNVSDTQLQVVAPAAAGPGAVDVRVTTPLGTSENVAADNYTYVAKPVVTSVSPRSGPTGGGTVVVISGFGFTGTTVVSFGGVTAGPTSVTETQVVVTSPARAAGTVHIRVTSAGGTSAETSADEFTYTTGTPLCPAYPFWMDDLAYGSPGGGFYWDPISGQVWTGQRGWHRFSPQPPRAIPGVFWADAPTYGSKGLGFYWDPVSGQVWTAERGWHPYRPQTCTPR